MKAPIALVSTRRLLLVFALSMLALALASACSTKTHQFTESASGGSGGSSGSTTQTSGMHSGGSHGGSDAHAGASTNGGDAPNAGAGGETAPTPPECNVGQQKSCWDLEDGTPIDPVPTEEKGSCHIGTSFCGKDEHWGPCLGAVGPKTADSCATAGNDDDCDGIPNEGCTCVDGTQRSCGTDTGSCVAGTQTCAAHAWGPCMGETKPLALDSCDTAGNDDNCNGKPNENCECVGNAQDSCMNGCGTHQCNPAARAWSACTPAASDCVSGTQARDCTDQGWVTSACKYACVDGQCTGSCTPTATKCAQNPERRQTCNAQGIWETTETCQGGGLCQDNGASCVVPCAGKKLCPGNVCAPLGGCCSDADCGGNFACVNGMCSTDTCQDGFNGPCGGACTKGCCSVNDCPDHPNMAKQCNGSHQCLYGCKNNYGNCDGNDSNGCEVDLINGVTAGTAIKNCGACGTTCDFHNPDGDGCQPLANTCAFAECQAEYSPPGDPTNQYAYQCPVDRPHASLYRGDCDIGCTYHCEPNYADCNDSASDGCETYSVADLPDCLRDPFWGGTF